MVNPEMFFLINISNDNELLRFSTPNLYILENLCEKGSSFEELPKSDAVSRVSKYISSF